MTLPPYGLSGNYMRFDPGSMILFVDKHPSDCIFLQSLMRDYSAGGGTEEASDPQELGQLGRLIHELDHFRRHLSTAYGLFRHAVLSVLVRLFSRLVTSFDHVTGPDAFPLLGFARDPWRSSLRCAEHPFTLTDRNARTNTFETMRLGYAACVEFVHALDGAPPFVSAQLLQLIPVVLSPGAHGLESFTDTHFVGTPPPAGELSRFFDTTNPFAPVVGGRPFGGNSLLEYFGIMRELVDSPDDREAGSAEWSDLLGEEEYRRVIQLCYSDLFSGLVAAGPTSGLLVEMEAAAELALWCPLTPCGIVPGSRPLSWLDLHPGWRFLKACDYLRRSGRTWRYEVSDDLQEVDEWLPRIQDEVCDNLGWPRVSAVVDAWLTFLRTQPRDGTAHPGWLAASEGNGRTRLAVSLLQARRDEPYSRYLRAQPDGRATPGVMFPGLVLRDGTLPLLGEIWTTPNGGETNWWEYWLITGSRFFAEGYVDHCHFGELHARPAAALLAINVKRLGGDGERVLGLLDSFCDRPDVRQYWDFCRRMEARRGTNQNGLP